MCEAQDNDPKNYIVAARNEAGMGDHFRPNQLGEITCIAMGNVGKLEMECCSEGYQN